MELKSPNVVLNKYCMEIQLGSEDGKLKRNCNIVEWIHREYCMNFVKEIW